MSINPFSQSVFSMTATCLPCCVGGASECGCQLFIPQVTSPPSDPPIYADATAAASAITNFVAGCYVYGGSPPPGFFTIPVTPLEDFTADWDAATNTLTFESGPYSAGSQPDIGFSGSISVSAGAVVTFDLARSPARGDGGDGMAYILVYTCDSTSTSPTIVFEENISNIGTGGSYNWTVTDAGTYFFVLAYTNNGTTTFSTSTSVSCDVDMAMNPVIARYDSGTPGSPWPLEACPRLFIPILTEATGDWYADETEAQDAIDAYVTECAVYVTDAPSTSSFSASVADDLVVVNITYPAPVNFTDYNYVSINLEEGEIIELAGTGVNVYFSIYSYEGVLIEYVPDATSSPVPYTGRYIIRMASSNAREDNLTDWTLTLTGTFTVNPVQALYDIELTDCPGRLDCVPPEA